MITSTISKITFANNTLIFSIAILFATLLLVMGSHDTVQAGSSASFRGFELHSDHNTPEGVWSDGSTMWILSDNGGASKLMAYGLATGSRLSSKDITLASYNAKPQGIWSDGAIMWVVDWDDEKLYAYNLDTGARMSDHDINLDHHNTAPRGILGGTSVIFVVDVSDDYVYAYNRANGERWRFKEFHLHSGNDEAWGILWQDGSYWVSDFDDQMLYRYTDLGSGQWSSGPALRLPLENADARGIWTDGETIWIVDDNDSHVYATLQKGFRHHDEDISISDVSTAGGIWADGETLWVADSGAGSSGQLQGYYLSDGSRDPYEIIDLTATNDSPVAIWSNEEFMWVADDDNRTLHAYALDGTGDYSQTDSKVLPTANADPTGIWSDGTLIWVADSADNKLYAYELAQMARRSGRDITLDPGNQDPGNIWSDGKNIWVFDSADQHAYAYGLRSGNRKLGREFRPVPANSDFNGGLTGHGLRFWVVDTADEKLFAYGKRNTPPEFVESTTRFTFYHSLPGGSLVGIAPEAIDVDGDTLTYSLSGGSVRFRIDSATREVRTRNGAIFDSTGEQFSLTLSVTDGKSILDHSDGSVDVSIIIPVTVVANYQPEFVTAAGATFAVDEDAGDTVVIADLDISNLDGDTLTVAIRNQDRYPFELTDGQISLKQGETLDYESVSTYDLTIRVRDGRDGSGNSDEAWDDEITVTVSVTNLDEPGEVSLSSNNPQVDTDLWVSLTDPDGSTANLRWQWQKADTADATTWTDIPGTTSARYIPVSDDAGKFLRAQASYDDGQGTGKTAHDTASNAVLAAPPTNQPPAFDDGSSASRSVPESADGGDAIGTAIGATDPNTGDTLTYGLTGGDANRFAIDATTGQVSLAASASLDYETKSSYAVQVRVRDSKDPHGTADTEWDASIPVTISVTDVDEAGVLGFTTENPQVEQEMGASLSDPDGSISNLTWQWQRADSAEATTWTDISGATSGDYTPVSDDEGKFLRANAAYDDGNGSGKTADAVVTNAVQPKPANQPPAFGEGTSATRSISEDSLTGTPVGAAVSASDPEGDDLTYSIGSGTDSDHFDVDSATGQLSVAPGASLDFETKPSLEVAVQVADGKDASHNPDTAVDATITVTVNLVNANEPGRIALSSTNPEEGTALTASVTDPDGSVSDVAWQWAKSEDGATGWTDISNAATHTYTPVAVDAGAYLRATGQYTDGEGADKQASSSSTNPVSIDANEPPRFLEGESAERSIAENALASATVGVPIAASDPEGDSLTYSLASGGDSDQFTVSTSTGQLSVATGAALDYESKPVLEVTLQVSDEKDADDNQDAAVDDTITVSINLTNIDEPGEVNLSSSRPEVGKSLTAWLADPDGGLTNTTWFWERSGDGVGNWESVNGGTSDSYTPVSDDRDWYLRATVSYTDGHGSNKSAAMISVNRVQAAPQQGGGSPSQATLGFYEQCQSDARRDLAARCGKNEFAVFRVELDGRYTIDWSEWDRQHPNVTGYTIILGNMVYRAYFQNGSQLTHSDTENVYELCEFVNGRWDCQGRLNSVYDEDMSGEPTQMGVVATATDQTQWTSALEEPGLWVHEHTFHRWSGDAADPANEPTPVSYVTKKFEMDLYRFIAHGVPGGYGTVLVDGANGFDARE